MSYYKKMQQPNTIQNAKKMSSEMKSEIYDRSFYYHPFHSGENNNLHTYSVIKFILELIHSENGIKAFDTNLYPDDFQIYNYPHSDRYSIMIMNPRFDETKDLTYDNCRILSYEVLLESEQQLHQRLEEHIEENICWSSPEFLFSCIKPNAFKALVEPTETPTPTNVYHNEGCPVCLEDYSGVVIKKVASCGHCLCSTCWLGVLKSSTSKCTECRMEWDELKNGDIEEIPYELDDIIEMCGDLDDETLLAILDMEQVMDLSISLQEAKDILGFDYEGETIYGEELPEEYTSMFQLPDYRIFIMKC